jgi:hypothetical protein
MARISSSLAGRKVQIEFLVVFSVISAFSANNLNIFDKATENVARP